MYVHLRYKGKVKIVGTYCRQYQVFSRPAATKHLPADCTVYTLIRLEYIELKACFRIYCIIYRVKDR